MDSRLGRIFCTNSPSQKARGASYNLLLLLRKDCLFCHRSEYLRTAVPFDQSGIHKELSLDNLKIKMTELDDLIDLSKHEIKAIHDSIFENLMR